MSAPLLLLTFSNIEHVVKKYILDIQELRCDCAADKIPHVDRANILCYL